VPAVGWVIRNESDRRYIPPAGGALGRTIWEVIVVVICFRASFPKFGREYSYFSGWDIPCQGRVRGSARIKTPEAVLLSTPRLDPVIKAILFAGCFYRNESAATEIFAETFPFICLCVRSC